VIVIDTSDLIAIANHEQERPAFLRILSDEDRRLISAVPLLETRMVIYGRFRQSGLDQFTQWLEVMPLEIVPFDAGQAEIAFVAFASYGKGINPASRLNFGDCIAYALAKSLAAPLLFKGQDFAATDITPAA
jgi:ribonuclease VapC